MNEIRLYSLDEVASILQLTPRTVYAFIHKGKLKAVKMGKSWRISDDSLRAFIEVGTKPAK